jgi:hypothetical protein
MRKWENAFFVGLAVFTVLLALGLLGWGFFVLLPPSRVAISFSLFLFYFSFIENLALGGRVVSAYMLFRILAAACVVAVAALGVAEYWDYISEKTFAITTAVLAVLVAIFAAFAPRPVGQEVVGAVDKVLTGYPADVLLRLQEQTQQAQALRNFVEIESNQIFLRKMHSYLENAIIERYRGSEIEKLITDLSDVESRMKQSSVTVELSELPSELRRTISQIELRTDQISALKEVVRVTPMPSFLRSMFLGLLNFYSGWLAR